jgi:hypothetical protein
MSMSNAVAMGGICVATMAGALAQPPSLPDFIAAELAAGKKKIVVPAGRYHVVPHNKEHLVFSGLRDVTIEARGVEMVCTETTRAITIRNCKNLTLRGLKIDYEPLPFTQGRIISISADELVYEIELFSGYPTTDEIKTAKYEVFEADGVTFRYDEFAPFRVEPTDGRHLRVVKSRRQKARVARPGDLIILDTMHAPGGTIPHAVYIEDSKGVRFEDFVLYASNCFGFLEVGCTRTVYRDCSVRRRPPETDPVSREHFRVRSLNADAFHSKAARHGPELIGCSAEYQGDDAVNITGSYHLISGIESERLSVLAHRGMDIEVGDRVEIVDRNGKLMPEARVVAIRPDGAASSADCQLVESLPILPMVRDLLKQRYALELDRKISVEPGAIICSRNRVGDGFRIIDCHFSRNRSRGVLVKASGGEIRNTTVEHCGMTGFLIEPSYEWLEGGFVRGLTLENCTVVNSGGAALKIYGIGPFPGHSGLMISRNRFETGSLPAIVVQAAVSAVFVGNTLNGEVLTERLTAIRVTDSDSVLFESSAAESRSTVVE